MMNPSENPTKVDPSRELDSVGYAQGKSRDEEARDSAQMLAYSLILAVITAIGIAAYANL